MPAPPPKDHLAPARYYQAMRFRGTGHQAALRQLSNRLVGILHCCLKTGPDYNEETARTNPAAIP
jgi:hypothetical protein